MKDYTTGETKSHQTNKHTQNLTELVASVSLNDLVSKYSPNGRTSGRTTTYSCPNPAHADHRPSFTVTITATGKERAQCFSQCAWHGDALEFVKWREGLGTAEAAKWLRRYLGHPEEVLFFPKQARPPRRSTVLLYSIQQKDSAADILTGAEADRFMAKYLESRGWPSEVVKRFALSVVKDSAGNARIRHPYYTLNSEGEWVQTYHQDRGHKTAEVKWLSAKGSTPQLFNLKSLEADGLEGVIICEGAADTITATLALDGCDRVAAVGVPGVGAWRDEWARFVNGLRIVVAADNDEAGRTLEQRVKRSVSSPVKFVRVAKEYGDITELANKIGLDSLRLLLLGGLGELSPATNPRTMAESVALLLAYFPQAVEVRP